MRMGEWKYWGRGTWEGEYGDGGEEHGEWESVGSMPKNIAHLMIDL
jgi:hypothetical protein